MDDGSPPNVMWPDSGSGFDASGFSPAGSAQRGYQFAQGLGRRRRTRWLVWVMLAWALSGIALIVVHLLTAVLG